MHLQLVGSGGEKVSPPVSLRPFTSQDRMRLGLKRGGLFFGFAVISVFIPIFHFFLVPLFLGLTVWMALRARKTRVEVPPFEAPCPRCGKPVVFASKLYLEDEMRMFCPNCRDQLKLTFE